MEGTIYKWGNYFSGWQKRYFVLNKDQLTYYDDLSAFQNQPDNFRGSTSINRNDSNIEVTGLFLKITSISNKDANIHLQFLSEADKKSWLIEIGTSRACQSLAIKFPEEGTGENIENSKLSNAQTQNNNTQNDSGDHLFPANQNQKMQNLKINDNQSTLDEDKYHSAVETHENHKDMIHKELDTIQSNLNSFVDKLETSPSIFDRIDDYLAERERRAASLCSQEEDFEAEDILCLKSENDQINSLLETNNVSEFHEKSNDLLKQITENLCKIQLLNKEYYDMMLEVENEKVKQLHKILELNRDKISRFEEKNSQLAADEAEQRQAELELDQPEVASANLKSPELSEQVATSDQTPLVPETEEPGPQPLEVPKPISESFFNSRQVDFSHVIILETGGIDTKTFLDACRYFSDVYDVIGGATFSPLKGDVMGNVTKLENKAKEYNLRTIQELVSYEIAKRTTTSKGSATDALVWLKRGLWLFCQFLSNVIDGEEDAQKAFSSSYNATLSKHHNFIVRGIVGTALRAFPGWEKLMPLFLTKHDKTEGSDKEVIMRHIGEYLKHMRPLLEKLDLFYLDNKLVN